LKSIKFKLIIKSIKGTVEPNSESEEKRLLFALECLKREDPSLRVVVNDNDNLGQTIIQGMGELHLDIIKDRILKEYKLKVFFGPLNIAYKEMPTKEIKKMINYEKSLNEKKNFVQIELSIIPCKDHEFKSVSIIKKGDVLNDFSNEYLNAVNHGVRSALTKGLNN
jgi:elongation factor G